MKKIRKHPGDTHSLNLVFNSSTICISDIEFLDTYEDALKHSRVVESWVKNISYRDLVLSISPPDQYKSTWPHSYSINASRYSPDANLDYPFPDVILEKSYSVAAFTDYLPVPVLGDTIVHRYTPIKFMSTISIGCYLEEEKFYNLVRTFLLLSEQHEFDEFFKVNGKALSHPHREGYEPLVRKISI